MWATATGTRPKSSVDAAWANRAVREAFWLFLGADAAPADVSALIREVHARGVADVVAAGAGAARRS